VTGHYLGSSFFDTTQTVLLTTRATFESICDIRLCTFRFLRCDASAVTFLYRLFQTVACLSVFFYAGSA
jgi:hypothetical protein